MVPGAAHLRPSTGHRAGQGIQVVPGASRLRPPAGLPARGAVVVPAAILRRPAGHHVAARVEAVDRPVDAQLRRRGVGAVLETPPPSERPGHPASGRGLVGSLVGGAHREGHRRRRVVVRARIVVAPAGLDRGQGGARVARRAVRVGHIHPVGLEGHRVAHKRAVTRTRGDLALAHEQAGRGHRAAHGHADGDAPGDTLPGQGLPRRAVARVLDLADGGLGLVLQDRVQGVRQAGTPVLVALDRLQAPPVRRVARQLLCQGHDLVGRHLGVYLAQRRDHGRREGRGLRCPVQVAVGLAVPGGQRRVDLRARSGEVDRGRAPVRPGRRLQHAGRRVLSLGQLQGGHREGGAQHGGHVHPTRHVALVGAPRVPRRGVVGGGRVVQVGRPVPGRHHVDDVLGGGVVGGSLHGLQARRLLRVARHPVLPRVDEVGAVGHRDAMVGGPHESAGDVLGVEVSPVARGHVDGGDAQRRVHAVHAHAVVLGGD